MPRDSFCVAGAVFAEVGVWLFVAGAAFGDILGDSRSAKCCIFQYKIVSEIGRVRSPKRRVRDDDFILGLSSDYPRIVFLLAEAIHGVSAEVLNLQISWQAQYLLRFEVDFACSAHSKWRFICDADQSWDAFCVAGAVFGEVGVWLFVAGAALGDILGDSRSAKCCIFQYKIVSEIGRVRSPKRRVRDDDFILGLSSDYPRIVFLLAEAIHGVSAEVLNLQISWQAQYLLRFEVDFACSAHSKWRFICDADQSWDAFCVAGAVFGEVGVWLFVAGAALGDILGDSRSAKCCIFQYKIVFKVGRVRSPRRRVRDDDFMLGSWSDYPRIVFILAEAIQRVSNAILNLKISWQAQYLVRLEGDFACSAHWKWRFICDADQSWDRGRRSIWWGSRLTLLAPRILNDVSYVTRINHEIHFAWQAQYLVRFEVDFACSAHSKWRFICEADQSWDSFCVAGAVFGEGGGWLLLLRAF